MSILLFVVSVPLTSSSAQFSVSTSSRSVVGGVCRSDDGAVVVFHSCYRHHLACFSLFSI